MARNPHLSSARRGFSLTELLVVIGVLVSLAGLVVPVVQRAAAISRRTKCATNLASIGQAYSLYLLDREKRTDVLRAPQWSFVLREYYSQLNPEAFVCPEDLETHWSWPYVQMETSWLGGRVEPIFELDPVWLERDHNDFVPKPKIWKVNDDVYQAMLGDWSLRQDMPAYTPGSNPNKYWFILEDIGDDDFYDFDVGVEEVADGSVIITGQHWANAHAMHHLVEPDGTRVPVLDGVGPFTYSTPQTSYAMSSQAYRLHPGMAQITFLDYESKSCNIMTDIGTDEGWDELKAPRHLGQMNVVFGDGSVHALWPDEINPESDNTDIAYYWGEAE